ncbi:hypothetical protein GCM10018775_35150 [Streptomyces umbrinus]|nr:hypothetical protein GCM10018775_35150 [Streptomyces umbrinus]
MLTCSPRAKRTTQVGKIWEGLPRPVVGADGFTAGTLHGHQGCSGDSLFRDVCVKIAVGVDRPNESVADDAFPFTLGYLIKGITEILGSVVVEGTNISGAHVSPDRDRVRARCQRALTLVRLDALSGDVGGDG